MSIILVKFGMSYKDSDILFSRKTNVKYV